MRRTKIVATIGPASREPETLVRMIEAGSLQEGERLPAERNLMLELARLPDVIDRTADLRAPNHLAEFAHSLAAVWNRFYDSCHILDEPDARRQASWLALADLTLRALSTSLDLLGIEVPDRM